MCLILFSFREDPQMPLVMAANRDEFRERPTEPALSPTARLPPPPSPIAERVQEFFTRSEEGVSKGSLRGL